MSILERFIPPGYRKPGVAQDYVQALGLPFDQARKWLSRLPGYLTPGSMPSAWLPWFAHGLGVPFSRELADNRLRAMLRIAVKTWLDKGTPRSIEAYLKAIAGVTATVTTTPPITFIVGTSTPRDPSVPGSTDSVVGTDSSIGSNNIVGTQWLVFDVAAPTGSITEAELRRLLKPVVPVFCGYTVTFT